MRISFALLLGGAAWVSAQGASSNAKVPVVGLTGGVQSSGERPMRANIKTMHANGGPHWDLYIQAMLAMQALPEDNELSWFQIMGIHGLPFESWNGVGQVSGGANQGYCPHNMVLFGSWHRPYLALYEQTLVAQAIKIAATYTGSKKASYVAAAPKLRIPFWDWASDSQIPPIVSAQTVSVNTPTGAKSLRNPLYKYNFQKFPFTYANFGGTIGTYPHTMRCPTTSDGTAVQSTSKANSGLSRDASQLKNLVYLTFTKTTQYSTMVTDATPGNNFESPHNIIHDDTGCGSPTGHMYNLGWSAFDPIFMLHHANVDRLLAIWQAINYEDQMFTSTFTSNGLYGTAAGSSYTEDSPLKPFYKADGTLLTSRDVTSTKQFGYSYPEIHNGFSMTPQALRTQLITKVNQLYGSASTNSAIQPSNDMEVPASSNTSGGTTQVTEYSANISVDRSELQLPCQISVYVNDQYAGKMSFMSMPTSGMSYGSIPIDPPLIQGPLSGPSPLPSIVDLLLSSVRVQVTSGDGSVQSLSSIPSLKANLVVDDVAPPTVAHEFPEYLNSTTFGLILQELESLL